MPTLDDLAAMFSLAPLIREDERSGIVSKPGMYGFQRLDLKHPELVVEPMPCGALDCSKSALWHVWQTHDLGGGFLCTACFHRLIDKGMGAPEFTELALEYVYE